MNNTSAANDHIGHEILVCGVSNTVFNGLSARLLMNKVPALCWAGDHNFVVPMVLVALRRPQ
jgi:hypothetical protein